MGVLEEEIVRVAGEAGLAVTRLDDEGARAFRIMVENAYSPGARRWPLWEATRFPAAIQDEQAWSWIGEFVGQRPCILLFNPADEPSMFRVESHADLDLLLRETSGFEFYVADEQASFLLCFNHHDLLLGAGAAVPWLERKIALRGMSGSS